MGSITPDDDGENAPPALFFHGWQQCIGERDDPQDHREEIGLELLGVMSVSFTVRRAAGIVDQNIDAAELVAHRGGHYFHEICFGKIGPDPIRLLPFPRRH